MALDKETAQQLWNERYRDELQSYSFRNKYLHPTKDPEDLFQDMAINVWLKAVNAFKPEKVTYTDDLDRAFNSFFTNILNQFLANLKKHQDTGKQQWERSIKSGDEPTKGDEADGPSLFDRMQGVTDEEDPDTVMDLQNLYTALPDDLAEPLKYIIEHADHGNISQIMKDVRDKWGWTQTRLFNALSEEPEFVEFITNI